MLTEALGGSAVQYAMPGNSWPAVGVVAFLSALATLRYCCRLWVIHDLLRKRPKDRIVLREGWRRFVVEITPTEPEEPGISSDNVILMRTPQRREAGSRGRPSEELTTRRKKPTSTSHSSKLL
jgi:hypothetical protein